MKYEIQVYTKEIQLEHTNRIRFIVGINYALASIKQYMKEINKIMNFEEEIIEIKKDFTFKRDTKLKVLAFFYIEIKAKQINNQLTNLKHDNVQYISYKHTKVKE